MFQVTRAYGFIGHKAIVSSTEHGAINVKLLLSSPGNPEEATVDERAYLSMSLRQFARFRQKVSPGDRVSVRVKLSAMLMDAPKATKKDPNPARGVFWSAFMRDNYVNGAFVSDGFELLWSRSKERREVPAQFQLFDRAGQELNFDTLLSNSVPTPVTA